MTPTQNTAAHQAFIHAVLDDNITLLILHLMSSHGCQHFEIKNSNLWRMRQERSAKGAERRNTESIPVRSLQPTRVSLNDRLCVKWDVTTLLSTVDHCWQATACSECAGPSVSCSSIKPLLQQLHWLPVRDSIIYKLALLVYKVQITLAPKYLRSLLQSHHNIRVLRSSIAPSFVMRPTRTEIAKRAFKVSVPTAWNALLSAVQLSNSVAGLKYRLKT